MKKFSWARRNLIGWGIDQRFLKNEPVLLNAIARFNFLIGRESYTGIVEKDYFEAKQYTFIIAIPEWVSV